MSTRPLVIQFGISNGEAQETSPGIGVFDGISEDGPWFYILTETAPTNDEYSRQHLAEIAEQEFSSERTSVTSRLRGALLEAHRWLSQENQGRMPEHRVMAGATCLAVLGDSIYLAQAGPSLAYLCNAQEIRRIEGPHADQPMGTPGDVEVVLNHRSLRKGDLLLLTSRALSRLAAPGVIAALLRSGADEAMQRLYLAVRDEACFSALLVAPSEAARHPSAPRKVKRGEPSPLSRIWSQFSPIFAVFSAKAVSVLLWVLGGVLAPFVAILRFIMATAHGIKTLVFLEEEPAQDVAEAGPERVRRSVFVPKPRKPAISRPLLLLAILVLLIAGVLSARYLPDYLAHQSEIRFTTLITQAEVLHKRGVEAADRDEARKHLREASRQVNSALGIKGDDGKALELRGRLNADLAKVDGIFELSNIKLLADGSVLQPAARELRQVVLQDNVLYLFDRGADAVYVFSLDAEGGLKLADSPGAVPITGMTEEGQPFSNVVDMLFMPPGELRRSGSVLFFDKNRNLIEYDTRRGLRPIKVRGAWEWASFQAAQGFGGNLYVLDSKARQVWRYIPTDAGYDSEMKPLLEDVDMGDAFDFAIDGNFYVLNRLGQVFKFSGGQLQRFRQQGIDRPLSNPSAIFGTADTKFIYVADTGNKRIVAFDKDGRFQRQLVSGAVDSPRSLHVDERRGRIYILSGNKLYLAALPK